MEYIINNIYSEINKVFTENNLTGMCLYSSILFYERLKFIGINNIELVLGIIKSNYNGGELFPHIWVEIDNKIYDIGLSVIINNRKDIKGIIYNHKYNEMNNENYNDLYKGLELYKKSSYEFWASFDGISDNTFNATYKSYINTLRDYFINCS